MSTNTFYHKCKKKARLFIVFLKLFSLFLMVGGGWDRVDAPPYGSFSSLHEILALLLGAELICFYLDFYAGSIVLKWQTRGEGYRFEKEIARAARKK